MNGRQLGALAQGMRHLRDTPDLAALRAARSPDELARLALIPAGRNLGIALGFLPPNLQTEAIAALMACRVLDAYEDLSERGLASGAVLAAAGYLNGTTDTPPPPLQSVAARDSEAVDLVLAERIRDVRALLSALPLEGQERVGEMLFDIGCVMARNLDSPLPRVAYGEGVLGRVVLYACALLAEDACAETDISELAGCLGVTAQLANDLRDGELAIYGAGDRAELIRAVMLRLLAPALGGFALLARLGPRTPSRGARVAMAYMTITTTAFLCSAVGQPAPRRWLRLARPCRPPRRPVTGPRCWSGCGVPPTGRSTGCSTRHRISQPDRARPRTCSSWGTLARCPLDGAADRGHHLRPRAGPAGRTPDRRTPRTHVRRMMIADHLAFGAVERLRPRDADAMQALATQFQHTALDTAAQGARP